VGWTGERAEAVTKQNGPRSNIIAKCLSNQFPRDLGILYGVMKEGGYHQICVASASRLGHKHCDFNQMIDIGLLGRTLAAVMDVPAGGGISGL
jgi:hypothetical protein